MGKALKKGAKTKGTGKQAGKQKPDGQKPAEQAQKKSSSFVLVRPSKKVTNCVLTEQLIEQFCELVVEGWPPDAVCNYLCISNTAFYAWMRKGEQHQTWLAEGQPEDSKPEADFSLYATFYLSFKKASGSYIGKMVKRLHSSKAAKTKSWIRDVTVLERRDRANFGKQDQGGGTMEQFDPDEKFV